MGRIAHLCAELDSAAASSGAAGDAIVKALADNGAGNVIPCVSLGSLNPFGYCCCLDGMAGADTKLAAIPSTSSATILFIARDRGRAPKPKPPGCPPLHALPLHPQVYPSCAGQFLIGTCCSQPNEQNCGCVGAYCRFRRVVQSPLVWDANGQRCVCTAA